MRKETKDENILLVQALPDGIWAVRWDFRPKLDENGNETDINWYEEEVYNFVPTIEDVQKTIIEWFNKQTDITIQYGFEWNGVKIYLNDENKFNYKAITDEASRREAEIEIWDKNNPEIAGKNIIYQEDTDADGNTIFIPISTNRPISLLPVTLKLGTNNTPENFHTFESLSELQSFFSAGVDHLMSAYGAGWYKIATFNWVPYVEALEQLK